MLNKLFFISLVVSTTGLFRFVALPFGVSVGQVSMALLGFNLFYLLNRLNYLHKMRLTILPLFIMLVAWPLLTLTYAPAIDVRQIGILLNGFVLLLGAAIYTMSRGPLAIHRVFQVSLIVTIFGVVLNMVRPELFESVALLVDARTLYDNRPGGFFLQPNSLALGIAFMFIGWIAFSKRNMVLFDTAAILVFFGLMLLTGSRGGMILAVVIVLLHFGFQWHGSLLGLRRTRGFTFRLVALFAAIFVFLIVGRLFIVYYSDIVELKQMGLINRMSDLIEFRLYGGSDVRGDKSIDARLEVLAAYWELIKDSPLIGYGFGTDTIFYETGRFFNTSHNSFISMTLDYGFFYTLFFLAMLAKVFFNPNRVKVSNVLGTNTTAQFLTITVLAAFINGNLLDYRVFFVVFGVVFAVLNFPSTIFNKHAAKPFRGVASGPFAMRNVSSRDATRTIR